MIRNVFVGVEPGHGKDTPYREKGSAHGFRAMCLVMALAGSMAFADEGRAAEPAVGMSRQGNTLAEATSIVVGLGKGQRAPEFELTSIDGREVVYNSGKPKVIFFMASWCITCVPEERALAILHRQYGDRVDIVSVDVDIRNDTVADLTRFRQDYGGDWPHVLNVEIAYLFRIRSLDSTVILNRHNVITYRDAWPTDFNTLERELLRVLPAERS